MLNALSSQEEICMIKSTYKRGNFSVKRYECNIAGYLIYTVQSIIYVHLTCFFRWSYGTSTKLPQQWPTFIRLGYYTG